MRVKIKATNFEYHYLKISLFTVIILTVLFGIIPSIASANPVATYGLGWSPGTIIISLFFINLVFDGMLLLIPLYLLSKLGYEKSISELWVFGLPLIAIWGAYIDTIFIASTMNRPYPLDPAGISSFVFSIFFIFVTYVIVIYFLMGHKLTSSLMIGAISGFVNAVVWGILYYQFFYIFPLFEIVMFLSGVLAFIFLIFLMLQYFIKKANQRTYDDANAKPIAIADNSILKASTSVVHTFFLLFLAFLIMIYVI